LAAIAASVSTHQTIIIKNKSLWVCSSSPSRQTVLCETDEMPVLQYQILSLQLVGILYFMFSEIARRVNRAKMVSNWRVHRNRISLYLNVLGVYLLII